MWKTILKRFLLMIPQLILLSILVFVLAKLMPGDPLTGAITPQTSAAQLAKLRQEYGLNDPWWTQYWHWIVNMFHGDLGQSYGFKRSVAGLIGERAVNTFWLSLLTIIIMYLVAIPLGVVAGRFQDTWKDKAIQLWTFVALAIPGFVFYLFGLTVFGYILQWLPTGGYVSLDVNPGTVAYWLSRLQHMILPAILAGLLSTAGTIQYLRSGVIDNTNEDFVRTARSKGVPERVVFSKHILRNSLLPIAAFMGNQITGLLGGSVFVEQIFGYPGMGQLFISSIQSRDYSVITALILLFGFLTLLGNLLSDIIMSIVDPRIRID
ncbi:oligopeptide ABC transporter permease [Lacticaseibacillus saniviri]|uniref:ABC-type dipeptide oligopeptide nickel transport system, permease component n=1 Tax=Lacticaseibacillus saniviri JCM 17471 = DSM 24301 TaxID=1293598 RepID=A0A0R2MYX8_9LACO|nr:oligopeptide ABC transporter permease [Lacticaseibacillus saniviri]KRO18601.1 ABC-type dipeptide oligopeptide nickel transport system, permease component [Lacticaseibacillus saniviri JCM 17471 = DSM 24301]MCG4282138.1 ABC transporter permease [Lacticaseibacillus saniviri]